MKALKVFTLIAVLVAAFALPPGAGAHDPTLAVQPGALTQHECHEVFAQPDVSYQVADSLVPDGYTVARDNSGTGTNAKLLVTVRICESLSVGNTTLSNAIDSYIAIGIVPPYSCPNEPCLTPPAQSCADSPCPARPPHQSFIRPGGTEDPLDPDGLGPIELYIVQWITNNQAHARWLKQTTGLGDKVKVVTDLAYEYQPRPGPLPPSDRNMFFRAPAPAMSPFFIEARVTEPDRIHDAAVNLWADTDEGTVIIYGEHHKGANQGFSLGLGTIGSSDPESPLGQMFGSNQTREIAPDETAVCESSEPARNCVDLVSGAFTDGQWTKCVRTDSNPCSPELHPDGGP